MAKTYRAQARYREKQSTNRGMVRISAWVPADVRERVLALCEKLRKQARAATTEDEA